MNYDPNAKSVIVGYSDSNYGADTGDRKSVSGTLVELNGDIISWMSKGQTGVAGSTCEAEYVAMYKCRQDILFIRNVLKSIGVIVEQKSRLFCDNRAALIIAEANVNHDRTKHIDIKYHAIRDDIRKEIIKVEWISSELNIADIFTKALPVDRYKKLRDKLLQK